MVQTLIVPLFKLKSARRMHYASTQCRIPQGWNLC